MQNNHQHAAPAQHNKQSRPRYDMQSQQQQYRPSYRSQGGGNIRQQHPGLQVGQQQAAQVVQVPGVQAHPQQIPQQATRAQQPQLTPPQYGAYQTTPGGQIIVSYAANPNQMGQPITQQQLRFYQPGVPATYFQTPAVAYNHLQQWQSAQITQQHLQNHAAQQQYYQQMQQQHGVQQMQPMIAAGGQQFYVRPTFVQGPALQSASAPPQQMPVQAQAVHQAHHAQHQQQPQQANPNVGLMQANQSQAQQQQQPEQREPVAPPPPRAKKLLAIVDPNTGKSVFDNVDTAPPASPAVSEKDSTQNAVDTSTSEEPTVTVSLNSATTPTTATPQASPSVTEETKPIIEEKDQKVRTEFYQKITKMGDDEGQKGRGDGQNAQPSTTASSTTTEISTPPSSTPPPPSTEQESANATEVSAADVGECTQSAAAAAETDAVDTSSQKTPITVSLNGTSGSIHQDASNASLQSISPTPIEKYVDAASPEAANASADISSVSSPATTEEAENRETIVSPDAADKHESPASEALSPAPEEKDDVPVVSYNSVRAELEEEKLKERLMELNLSKTTEGGNLQNGKAEVVDDDHDEHHDEDEEPMEEGEINENEDAAAQSSAVKRRIMYNRDELLAYKQNKDAQHLDIHIPPDLVKDPNRSNAAQHGNFNFKGSQMGPPPHMGQRGMPPMRSQRGGGGMPMGQPGRMGGWMGPMGSGGPFAIPPPLHSQKPPKVIELQREKVVLHKAENAWKPSAVAGRGKGDGEPKDEEEIIQDDIVKKTRSILNKLTPENFEKLVNKFLQLNLEDKDERIGKVIHVVFEKAVDEPAFATSYAQMVRTICDKSQETAKKFRKQILDQCQKEFQQGNTAEEEIKKLEEALETAEEAKKAAIKQEIEEKRFATRRRALGNVRFIGELFKLSMLTPKIMVECVGMLLSAQDEESYECLCKLLTTVGQRLEESLRDAEARAQDSIRRGVAPKFVPDPKFMDKTFSTLKTLSANMKLSSRIRFALLDVFELRDNGWKPRRDAAGPKKIDEVRRDAVRQEQEEKRQLQNLPPAQPMGRLGQVPQQKKGDWSTVPSSKSSRFVAAMRKPADQTGPTGLVLGPQGGAWSRGPMSQGPPSKPPQHLPPRFMNNKDNNKFSALSPEERTPFRHEIVQEPPPPIRSPPVVGNASRESSRPQTPSRDQPPPQPQPDEDENLEPSDERDREVVKNIFEEFALVRKFEDTIFWIQDRFKGRRIYSFIEQLSRLVSEMSKEEQQKTAGSLLSTFIRKDLVNKNEVIKSLKDSVISELYDIAVDVPMVTSYMAVFLVELFFDELDLLWLLEFESVFDPENEEEWTVWRSLVTDTLNILKLRRNEEAVQQIFKQTNGAERFPVDDLPWVTGETVDSLSKKMIKVLEEEYPKQKDFNICSEQFDLRHELTSKSLIQALCVVCWKEDEQQWNIPFLEEVLEKSRLPVVSDHLPFLWKQAKEFITSNKIDEQKEQELWKLMNKLNLLEPSSHERDTA